MSTTPTQPDTFTYDTEAQAIQALSDSLRECAKQLRQTGSPAHAEMAEANADAARNFIR